MVKINSPWARELAIPKTAYIGREKTRIVGFVEVEVRAAWRIVP
jgi:hypothetical protein